MRTIVVLLWLILTAEIVSLCFLCMNEANTIQNYIGIISLVIWILISYKMKLGLWIHSKLSKKDTS